MTTEHGGPESLPPGASPRARRFARMLASPIERFLHIQAASGIILLFNGVIALVWANSPWASTYAHILHTPIALGLGELAFVQPVHFWINDVLMVIFFFVVGLEVRRELFEGELSELRRASLPVAAALGGMLVPAAIYLSINAGAPTVRGWGTPMATDIAFAVGVLALLGRRVPASLRVLLLAVAIIDDIGAILVIALFYSSGLVWTGLGIAGIGILLVLLMQRIGVRSPPLYVLPGLVIWSGILHAGIHPTIAGVILGLLTPARSWFGPEGFVTETQLALDRLREKVRTETDPRAFLPEIDRINVARRESIPPVTLIESALHPWVAFGIMPLFALANAGVSLEGLGSGGTATTGIVLGVGLGLMLGKPLGILAFSWLAVRLGLASLPRGVSWSGLLVVGSVAGIGFTMALFIAALAFPDPTMLGVAKISVLLASAVAGVLALIVGFWTLPVPQASDDASITPANAEASTEH